MFFASNSTFDCECKSLSGKIACIVTKRMNAVKRDPEHRRAILRECLLDGAKWEPTTAQIMDRLCAVASKKQGAKPNRLGAKKVRSLERLETQGDVLKGEDATLFRALAARANYLALDRPDLAFASKELCRDFSSPTIHSVHKLQRLVRFLYTMPRLVWHFAFQDAAPTLSAYVDTDFAGCLKTRRSTSGGAIMRGGHLLQHWSQTQTTVALSSGEAELSGICKGASKGIGLRSLCTDLGLSFSLTALTDATAAIGMCRRRGLGKISHLAVADLWIQDRVKTGDFALQNVAGAENPADLLTKHVEYPVMMKHLSFLGLVPETCRAERVRLL